MPNKSGQIALIVVCSLLFFFFIFIGSISKTPIQIVPLIVILAPIVFFITFINTDLALILLIFSMLLSPELKIADIPQRAVVIRIDDILLFVVFFSWLAKMAIHKKIGLLKYTRLNLPIAAYVLIYIVSTAKGIITGDVGLFKSSFYILKYIEYFMLFFMVSNNIRSKEQIKHFIIAFLVTCALTCAYALATFVQMGRATAPFEGIHGEPNTLGGYLVLLFAIAIGHFLYVPSRTWRFWCAALCCLMFVTLLQTLSRGSYLAFIPMFLTLLVLTKKRKMLLTVIFLLSIIILPAILPGRVVKRIEHTFVQQRVYQTAGRRITLDQAAAARIDAWQVVFNAWKKRVFFGFGVTGVGLVDTQYPRVLGETGIVGFLIFLWLLNRIFRNSLRVFRTVQDDWAKALTLGFLAGYIGLIIHCFAANTFIIVRIMEPFWFLAAIITVLPSLESEGLKTQNVQPIG